MSIVVSFNVAMLYYVYHKTVKDAISPYAKPAHVWRSKPRSQVEAQLTRNIDMYMHTIPCDREITYAQNRYRSEG